MRHNKSTRGGNTQILIVILMKSWCIKPKDTPLGGQYSSF